VKELKGFKQIFLKAGEAKIVSLPLRAEALSLLKRGMRRVIEPGVFHVMAGLSVKWVVKVAGARTGPAIPGR
jgi:beta-glucosidase